MPTSPFSPKTYTAVGWLEQIEAKRKAREDAMRNALEILAIAKPENHLGARGFGMYVRATAREGLGRDGN